MAKQPDEGEPNMDAVLNEILASAPTPSDTANALVEVYERTERIYRASLLAGQSRTSAASRTDLVRPI